MTESDFIGSIKSELCGAIKEVAEAVEARLSARISELERLVNDVIIKSALDADRDDRYAANKAKWESRVPPEIGLLEPEGYDFYAEVTDGLSDEGAEAKIAGWIQKLQAIRGASEEARAEAVEALEKVAEEASEPEIKEGLAAPTGEPVFDEADVEMFRRGGRIAPKSAKSAAGVVGHADSSRGQPHSRGKSNPGLEV